MSEINFINLLGSTCTVLHIYLLLWDLEILHQKRERWLMRSFLGSQLGWRVEWGGAECRMFSEKNSSAAKYLLSCYYVPGTVLTSLHSLFPLIYTIALWNRYYSYFALTDKETEAQIILGRCVRHVDKQWLSHGFNRDLAVFKTQVLNLAVLSHLPCMKDLVYQLELWLSNMSVLDAGIAWPLTATATVRTAIIIIRTEVIVVAPTCFLMPQSLRWCQ